MIERSPGASRKQLIEVLALFLRLGSTAFGGPAAHVALMHDEIVVKRKWMDNQAFLDLISAANLIPGPNSTEVAIHVGYRRAGKLGLVTAGAAFILPAVVIVTILAWAYTRFGSTAEAGWLLYGIKPVIILIVLKALIDLGKAALTTRLVISIALLGLGLYFLRVHELLILLLAGLAVMLITNRGKISSSLPLVLAGIPLLSLHWQQVKSPVKLDLLFFTFLKIGSVLYGSGYVLLAFLRSDFVERLGWITNQQLIDAVAVGQVTPGPVFTTATFIGYILAGVPGALIATLGIFLPAFLFVALSVPYLPRLQKSPWFRAFLNGVNAGSLALMAGVTYELGRAAIIDGYTVMISLVSALLLFRWKINTTWIILLGAIAGGIHAAMF